VEEMRIFRKEAGWKNQENKRRRRYAQISLAITLFVAGCNAEGQTTSNKSDNLGNDTSIGIVDNIQPTAEIPDESTYAPETPETAIDSATDVEVDATDPNTAETEAETPPIDETKTPEQLACEAIEAAINAADMTSVAEGQMNYNQINDNLAVVITREATYILTISDDETSVTITSTVNEEGIDGYQIDEDGVTVTFYKGGKEVGKLNQNTGEFELTPAPEVAPTPDVAPDSIEAAREQLPGVERIETITIIYYEIDDNDNTTINSQEKNYTLAYGNPGEYGILSPIGTFNSKTQSWETGGPFEVSDFDGSTEVPIVLDYQGETVLEAIAGERISFEEGNEIAILNDKGENSGVYIRSMIRVYFVTTQDGETKIVSGFAVEIAQEKNGNTWGERVIGHRLKEAPPEGANTTTYAQLASYAKFTVDSPFYTQGYFQDPSNPEVNYYELGLTDIRNLPLPNPGTNIRLGIGTDSPLTGYTAEVLKFWEEHGISNPTLFGDEAINTINGEPVFFGTVRTNSRTHTEVK
jgi:hypothetical protein